MEQKKKKSYHSQKSVKSRIITVDAPKIRSRIVCSHHIMVELNRVLPQVPHAILHDETLPELDFKVYGTFTPEDVLVLARHLQAQGIFKLHTLYPVARVEEQSNSN